MEKTLNHRSCSALRRGVRSSWLPMQGWDNASTGSLLPRAPAHLQSFLLHPPLLPPPSHTPSPTPEISLLAAMDSIHTAEKPVNSCRRESWEDLKRHWKRERLLLVIFAFTHCVDPKLLLVHSYAMFVNVYFNLIVVPGPILPPIILSLHHSLLIQTLKIHEAHHYHLPNTISLHHNVSGQLPCWAWWVVISFTEAAIKYRGQINLTYVD